MAWTPENFQFLLAQLRANTAGHPDVEVRETAMGSVDLGETLSAFGNGPDGGTIILGLDPHNGYIATGIEDPDATEAAIAFQGRTAVIPPVRVSFARAELEGETVVIATVTGLTPQSRPCRTANRNLAFLRQVTGNYRMSEQEIRQVSAAGQRPRFDAVPLDETSVADLDPHLRNQFLATARSGSRRLGEFSDEDILRFKRVIEPHGPRLTLAGLYALGRYPQQFVPQLSITAVLEAPTHGGANTTSRSEFDGPLPEMLDRAAEWVSSHTRTGAVFASDDHGDEDETEIPMDAVRELIANALVHRDLGPHTSGRNILLRLSGEHLSITNPGGLCGLSRDQLGEPGGKSAVNEFLYEICKLTRTSTGHRVIDGEGAGLRDVRGSLTTAGYRHPGFHDNGVRFTVSIPRRSAISPADLHWLRGIPASERLSDLQGRLLVSMLHGHSWTERLVRDEYASIDVPQAREALLGLVAEGLSVTSGANRNPAHAISPVLASMPPGALTPADSGRTPRHVQTPAEPELRPEPRQNASGTLRKSKNADIILGELQSGPLEVTDISSLTGLTANQIRYALSPLLSSGTVIRDGGQGHKTTSYSLAGL